MSSVLHNLPPAELLTEYDIMRTETLPTWNSALECGVEEAAGVLGAALIAAFTRTGMVDDQFEQLRAIVTADNRDLFALSNGNPDNVWNRIKTGNWEY